MNAFNAMCTAGSLACGSFFVGFQEGSGYNLFSPLPPGEYRPAIKMIMTSADITITKLN